MNDKIKVLVVDDSRVYRGLIERNLKKIGCEVIGSVFNGLKALEFIKVNRPDVITLDIDMPVMNGIETLKAIVKINESTPNLSPIRVVMLSMLTKEDEEITLEALRIGAFDFIEKPSGKTEAENERTLMAALSEKVCLSTEKAHTRTAVSKIINIPPPSTRTTTFRAVVIGVSTGGPKVLNEMLPELCKRIKLPIFLVQHMPQGFTKSLASQLDKKCSYNVIEATDGMGVEDNTIYIAPGGVHMEVKQKGTKIFVSHNAELPPENGCKPCVDILFRSAARVYAANCIGLVLTGMGADGAKGAEVLKQAGAYIVVQDEKTSVVWGMPGSTYDLGVTDVVSPHMGIPNIVETLVKGEV